MQFRARLDAVRSAPSRTEDARSVTSVVLKAHTLEGHDQPIDGVGEDVPAVLRTARPTATPIEQAVAGVVPVPGGGAREDDAVASSAGRRHGTRAEP